MLEGTPSWAVFVTGPFFLLSILCFAAAGVVIVLRKLFTTQKTLKELSDADRNLFDQGWVRPDCLYLYGRKLQYGMYVIYHAGSIELAIYMDGHWVFEKGEPPISGQVYVHIDSDGPIYTPSV